VLAVLSTVLSDKKPSISRKEEAASGIPAQMGSPTPRGGLKKPKKTPKLHEFGVRVTYADTDKLGIIYYANYFKYFEQGRTELLRSLGVRYRDLEIQRKLFLPAVEARCRYLAPSRYDDLLIVRTWISSMGMASVSFENEVLDQDLGGKKVARGFSRHAVVNDLWRTARIPEDLKKLLEPYVGTIPE
jgi:acyl-CoA thioester hydrolase